MDSGHWKIYIVVSALLEYFEVYWRAISSTAIDHVQKICQTEPNSAQIIKVHNPIIFSEYVDVIKSHIYALGSVTISNRTDIHAFEASSASVESQHPSSLKHQQQAEP